MTPANIRCSGNTDATPSASELVDLRDDWQVSVIGILRIIPQARKISRDRCD
jgi:hypothetical protein